MVALSMLPFTSSIISSAVTTFINSTPAGLLRDAGPDISITSAPLLFAASAIA